MIFKTQDLQDLRFEILIVLQALATLPHAITNGPYVYVCRVWVFFILYSLTCTLRKILHKISESLQTRYICQQIHTPFGHVVCAVMSDNHYNIQRSPVGSSIFIAEAKAVDLTLKLVAPVSDIPIFYIKYLTMHKVHMHAGAIRQLLYEPRHEISNNVVCATIKGSELPAHTRSLIRAFASR